MELPGPLAVLRHVLANPSLRRVLFAYLAFHVAEFATWVTILLYAYEQTGPASVGVVALIQLVPAALIAPPAGTSWVHLWSSEHPDYGGRGTPAWNDKTWMLPAHSALVLGARTHETVACP